MNATQKQAICNAFAWMNWTRITATDTSCAHRKTSINPQADAIAYISHKKSYIFRAAYIVKGADYKAFESITIPKNATAAEVFSIVINAIIKLEQHIEATHNT